MSKDYPVITQGQTLEIRYTDINKTYRFDVIETKPAEIISTVNTDISLEFDQPLDYVEPHKPPQKPLSPIAEIPSPELKKNKIISREVQLKSMQQNDLFTPFSGQGNRLGES